MSQIPPTAGPDGPPTMPQPAAPQPYAPEPTQDAKQSLAPFWHWLRSLGITRSSDRWIGGVAGGIADRYGLDPLLVRGLFVVAAMLGGVGFIAYALGWAFLPEPDGRIHAEELAHGRFDQADLGIGLFLLAGLDPFGAGRSGSWMWGVGKGLGWLALIGLGVWLWSEHRSTTVPPTATTDPWGSPRAPESTSASSASSASFASAAPQPTAAPGVYDAGYEPAPPASAAPKAKEPKEKAPTPPKPNTSPNRGYVAAVVGLAGLAVAGLLIADRIGAIDASWLLILATALGVLGLGIVIAGLAGRRGGFLSFLAVVGLVLVPSAANRELGWNWDFSGYTIAGSADWTPTTAAEAESGLRVAAGDAVIDLTQVPLPAAGEPPLVVPVRVTAGNATITVPSDTPLSIEAKVFAGSANWDVEGVTGTADHGLSSSKTVRLVPEEEARLVLDLVVTAGDASIEGAAS